MRKLLFIFLFPIFLFSLEPIDIAKIVSPKSILKSCDVYFNKNHTPLKVIEQTSLFKPFDKDILNNAESKNIVWVKCKFTNSSNKKIKKTLQIKSPTIANIELFDNIDATPIKDGSAVDKKHPSIYYYFDISLKPKSSKIYYLKLHSKYKSFFFKLYIGDYKDLIAKDIQNLSTRLVLLGFLSGLMIYFFILSFYTKDRSYIYYSIYLFFVLWHQLTFLGLIKIYFPNWFVLLDLKLTIAKLGFILIFAILYAITFLQIDKKSFIFKIYTLFLIIGLLIILINDYLPIVLIIGVFFVFFNLFSGIYAYFSGRKQARLFIVGFGVVSISYVIVILDTFGITKFLLSILSILLWATIIEILFLSLAFADKYQILQREKEKLLKDREKVIQKKVDLKTKKLDKALKEKDILLKEVHHRVKNNLQMIISIMKLQSYKFKNQELKNIFASLENRIFAIAATYEMLVREDNLEYINMQSYFRKLIDNINNLYSSNKNVEIKIDANIKLPLQQAIYVGILINELVTNSYKYAFDKDGKIEVLLFKDSEKYNLIYKDNGKGFSFKLTRTSLGLKLLDILVKEQLEGEIEYITKPSFEAYVSFKL